LLGSTNQTFTLAGVDQIRNITWPVRTH
jgi:hypothetical protein